MRRRKGRRQSAWRCRWDNERRELRAGPLVVRCDRTPSPNQEAVLAAFQEEGWPPRIDDPIRPEGDMAPKPRLHDTIRCLNRHHQADVIHFKGDGTGEGICWQVRGDRRAA